MNPALPTNEMVMNKLLEKMDRVFGVITENYTLSRSALGRLFTQSGDPRRNIEDECGYPQQNSPLDLQLLENLYRREPLGNRVVHVYPKECWQTTPLIYEEKGGKTPTAFEEAWDRLGNNLSIDNDSWSTEELGSPVWNYLRRLDSVSRIGHYGVLLLGFGDNQPLDTPVQVKPGLKLNYLRVFSEKNAQIAASDTDPTSRRFGFPEFYNLSFNNIASSVQGYGVPTPTLRRVHWSRLIHIADNADESDIFGVPSMEPVIAPILDARKIAGAGAEGYWKMCIAYLFFETHPQLGGDVDIDETKMKDLAERLLNGLERIASLSGMSAKSVGPSVIDPSPFHQLQVRRICIALGIPERIFIGSERGELASSQDDAAWNDRLKQRQNDHITPNIIRPFVNRLIACGVLPEPKQYWVEWPDLTSNSDSEKAAVANQKTTALGTYAQAQLSDLMAPMDFLTKVMAYNEEEAEAILENAEKYKEEMMEKQAEEQEAAMAAGIPMPGQPQIPGQPPISGQPPANPNVPPAQKQFPFDTEEDEESEPEANEEE